MDHVFTPAARDDRRPRPSETERDCLSDTCRAAYDNRDLACEIKKSF